MIGFTIMEIALAIVCCLVSLSAIGVAIYCVRSLRTANDERVQAVRERADVLASVKDHADATKKALESVDALKRDNQALERQLAAVKEQRDAVTKKLAATGDPVAIDAVLRAGLDGLQALAVHVPAPDPAARPAPRDRLDDDPVPGGSAGGPVVLR